MQLRAYLVPLLRRPAIASALALLAAVSAGSLSAETRYEIDLADAASGLLHVEMETGCNSDGCELQMPVWNATYQVRDFVQFVEGFRVSDHADHSLSTRKLTPSRWRVNTADPGPIRVRYDVRANRPGPFGAYAGKDYVSLNLAQVLVYPVSRRRAPFSLRFRNEPRGWRTALALESHGGRFRAASYDELIDTPVLLGDFDDTKFTYTGRPIRVVAHGGKGTYDLDELADKARTIVESASAIMDDVPFPSYLFVYHFNEGPGGGMEYRNGTSIQLPPSCTTCDPKSLTAHELFHAWNVKRIRPQSLEPIDFTGPNPTPSLWFAEGVTSAYAQYILLKGGLTGESRFLDHVSKLISRYERTPAGRSQSVEEASVEAWLERYPDYRRPDRSVSYYLSGEIVGHLLDLTIRHYSGNRRSLDNVMRALNERYAKRGRYYEPEAIEELASDAAGRDLSVEFDEWIRTPGPFEWDRYLEYAGYRLEMNQREKVELGLSLQRAANDRAEVASVEPGGLAARAGFHPGDQLLALNDEPLRVPAKKVADMLGRSSGPFTVEVERKSGPLNLTVKPLMGDTVVYRIVDARTVSPLQRAVRRGWLERTVIEDAVRAAPSARAR